MSIPNTFQGLLGTSIGRADSFCCNLQIVWHGMYEWTCLAMSLFMFGQNMLPFAWYLDDHCKGPLSNRYEELNFPGDAWMFIGCHPSIARMVSGSRDSFLQDSGQPYIICWISSWSVLSCCVSFWMDATCIPDSLGWVHGLWHLSLWFLSSFYADSAECINHCNVFTWNILNDNFIWLYLKQQPLQLWWHITKMLLVYALKRPYPKGSHEPKTTTNISRSILAYLISAGTRILDANGTCLLLPWLYFCMSTAPSHAFHASTCVNGLAAGITADFAFQFWNSHGYLFIE